MYNAFAIKTAVYHFFHLPFLGFVCILIDVDFGVFKIGFLKIRMFV